MMKSSLGPGFRFHPTDVELVMYYLKRKLLKKRLVPEVIAEVNIYEFSPWDLPDKSNLKDGDLEWFFFCSKSRKYSSGSRMNRATETGYWKATGKDREVKYKEKTVAMIRTLVFYLGHPPKGTRTDWVMHEYRMEDTDLANAGVLQEAYVLCRLFKKSGAGPKNGAQYGAPFMEEDWDDDDEEVNLSGGTTETLTHIDLTEPGPFTATSEKERHFENCTVTCSTISGQYGATKALAPYASSSSVTNMALLEPCPFTTTNSGKERHEDLLACEDDMMTHEDIAAILHNNTQGIKDDKGKKIMTDEPNEDEVKIMTDEPNEDEVKIMTDEPNEDEVICLNSATLSNLDDLSEDGFNMLSTDGSSCFMLDTFTADDLDDDLEKFLWG